MRGLVWLQLSIKQRVIYIYQTVPIAYGKQKWDITTGSYACIAPVGGHTCPTAGERSEPAVVDYKRMNVSVFVPLFRGTSKEFAEGVSGGPTATNGRSQNREVRGKQQDKFNNL